MHNFDELFAYFAWIALGLSLVGGFVVGFYTGLVSIQAVNNYKKNKKIYYK